MSTTLPKKYIPNEHGDLPEDPNKKQYTWSKDWLDGLVFNEHHSGGYHDHGEDPMDSIFKSFVQFARFALDLPETKRSRTFLDDIPTSFDELLDKFVDHHNRKYHDRPVTTVESYKRDEDGKIIDEMRETRKYNTEGRLIEKYEFDKDGKMVDGSHEKRKYSAYGEFSEMERYNNKHELIAYYKRDDTGRFVEQHIPEKNYTTAPKHLKPSDTPKANNNGSVGYNR